MELRLLLILTKNMINRICNFFNTQFLIAIFVSLLISILSQDIRHKILSSENCKSDISRPVVIGYGEGTFKIGELLNSDSFHDESEWVVQIQDSDTDSNPAIKFGDGMLEVVMPDRGATIWNQNKFSGSIAITYKVKASTDLLHKDGIAVRDINTFWHASDPENPEAIFDYSKYTGAFNSYHKQYGYYASIGGRENTTTRFRRYPRSTPDGKPVKHISLADKDGIEGYLIQPDKTHSIQLVAFEDIVQYIVDEKVVYEIREGDSVTISVPDGSIESVEYTKEQFLFFSKGWFGFRLVNSHHYFSDFKVYSLEPVD